MSCFTILCTYIICNYSVYMKRIDGKHIQPFMFLVIQFNRLPVLFLDFTNHHVLFVKNITWNNASLPILF